MTKPITLADIDKAALDAGARVSHYFDNDDRSLRRLDVFIDNDVWFVVTEHSSQQAFEQFLKLLQDVSVIKRIKMFDETITLEHIEQAALSAGATVTTLSGDHNHNNKCIKVFISDSFWFEVDEHSSHQTLKSALNSLQDFANKKNKHYTPNEIITFEQIEKIATIAGATTYHDAHFMYIWIDGAMIFHLINGVHGTNTRKVVIKLLNALANQK